MDWDDGTACAEQARHDNDGNLAVDSGHLLHVSVLLLLDTNRTYGCMVQIRCHSTFVPFMILDLAPYIIPTGWFNQQLLS